MMESFLVATLLLVEALHTESYVVPGDLELRARGLRYSHNNRVKLDCKSLGEDAIKKLDDLYDADFECDCSNLSTNIYKIRCETTKEVCEKDEKDDKKENCAKIVWEGTFNSALKPEETNVCIEHNGEEACFETTYRVTRGGRRASSCRAEINGKKCSSCDICGDLHGTKGTVQKMAADCSNIEGYESKKFECEDVNSKKDMRKKVYALPQKEEKTTSNTTTNSTKKPEDKEEKGSKNDHHHSKSDKGGKSKSGKSSKRL